MENLFIDKYEFEKKANKPLEGGMLQWPAEITRQLYSQFPALANYPYALDYHNVDEKTRSAKGSVVIKTMEIPFIIETGQLKPMLVYHLNDQPVTTVMPITDLKIQQTLEPQSFSKGLTHKGSKGVPRIQGSSTTIVQTKTASLLEGLDGTVYPEDKKKLLTDLVSDPRLIMSLDQNDTAEVLEKVSSLHTVSPDDMNLEVEHDVHFIYKNAGLGYTKLSGNSSIYDPKVELISSVEEPLIKTSARGKIFELVKQSEVSDVLKLGSQNYKMVRMDDEYSKDGVILVSSKGSYINDFEKSASFEYSPDEVNLPITKDAHPGDTVLVKTAEGRYFGPVKVAETAKVKGKRILKGSCRLKKAEFIETDKLTKTVLDKKTNTFFTPHSEYIKLASREPVKKVFNDFVKSAHTVAKRHGQYYLIGPEFNKLASYSGTSNPYSKEEALWTLVQLGASEETIKKAESLARGEFFVNDRLNTPVLKTRILEKAASDISLIRKYIDRSYRGLVKEAVSSIADKKSLDVILGINLINEENLTQVIEYLPHVEQALNTVSQLYLMACVGLNSLDRGALEIVLKKLGAVRDNLEQLAYVLKTK